MGNINIDITKSYVLQAITERVKPESMFFTQRYFGTDAAVDVFTTDEVLVEYKQAGKRKMANFVSSRGNPIPVERSGYDVATFRPAYIAESRTLTVDELAKRGFGEPLIAGSTPAERAVRLIADDIEELDARLTRRIEWMCVQCMLNNEITMQEYVDVSTPGEQKRIRFFDGDTSEHLYTTAAPWNGEDANIIGDVYAMCETLAARGIAAADLVIGADVADVFYSDPALRQLLDRNIAYNFGAIDERIIMPGVSELGTLNFRGHLLRVIVVSTKYEDESGVTQSYFPADAAMVTVPGCGRVAYGAVTLMPYGSDNYETLASPRVTKLTVDNPRNVRTIELYSRPIAMPRVYTPYIVARGVVG